MFPAGLKPSWGWNFIMDNIVSIKTVTHTSVCTETILIPLHIPDASKHSCMKSQLGCGAEWGGEGVLSAKLHMLLVIWCNFFF